LIATCWALGIPVVHLRVFPLDTKSMHAMVVTVDGRFAILLGRDASYPAPVAFTLAHELGHVLLRHLDGTSALIDLEDPATAHDADKQELEADAFALTLLTGSSDPDIQTNVDTFNATSLAAAVLDAGPRYRVEPGTLALCLARIPTQANQSATQQVTVLWNSCLTQAHR
jgi:Zn-dependent peptidase ImmA (M78 family)